MYRATVYLLLFLAGCSSMLPHGDANVEGPWKSFEEAQQTFAKIVPYRTTVEDLKSLDIDPHSRPNITILNYSDVLRRFVSGALVKLDDLDEGVRECINAKTACQGYEINQKSIKRNRTGNFISDYLNFKRETVITGWSFNGVLLIKDNVVIYKLAGGRPLIHEEEKNQNPLGPLQGAGESAVRNSF